MIQGLFPYKLYVLILYAAFGLACLRLAGAPGRVLLPGWRRRPIPLNVGVVALALAGLLLVVADLDRGHLLVVDAAAVAALLFVVSAGAGASLSVKVAGIATGVVVLSLAWWEFPPAGGVVMSLGVFGVIAACLGLALRDPGPRSSRFAPIPRVAFVLAGLALMVDLGTFATSRLALGTMAHHWGAFTGPVAHLGAGLVPFYDVPLQYGLGPTLAIAATCDGHDCWRGLLALATGANLANGLLVLAMALATTAKRGVVWQGAVTAIVFAALFLWPGFPSDGNMLMATPAVAGIRFLPLTLVGCLLFFDRMRWAMAAMVPALLWSPESAAMSLVVFGFAGTARFGIVRTAAIALGLGIASYGGLVLVHRLVYGLWIDPLALVEYVLHVPGALPIDPFSDILLLAAVLGLGGWLTYRAPGDATIARRDLVATALLFAASSYCLGRSHPNNVCNLAPYLVLVAVRALDRDGDAFDTVRRATAFGLAVSVAALALSPWVVTPFVMPPVIDIRTIVAAIPSLEPDVQRIRAEIAEVSPLPIADFGPARIRAPSETIVWTPMDPSSLWGYVPSDRRQVYIARAARRLKRSGWAIVAADQLFLIEDIASAYTMSNQRVVVAPAADPRRSPARYVVACFDPKPALVPTIVGPPCPAAVAGRHAQTP